MFEQPGQAHEIAATGTVENVYNNCRKPLYVNFLGFAGFVATLNAKDETSDGGASTWIPTLASSRIRLPNWMTSFSVPEPKASKRASNFTLEVRIQPLQRIN